MDFPDIWYIEQLPIELLTYEQTSRSTAWFRALVEDIGKRGMVSPILVENSTVRYGNNRISAAVQLDWTHVSALLFGELPAVEARKLSSLAECQALLGDGIIGHTWGRFKVNSTTPQQQYIYP